MICLSSQKLERTGNQQNSGTSADSVSSQKLSIKARRHLTHFRTIVPWNKMLPSFTRVFLGCARQSRDGPVESECVVIVQDPPPWGTLSQPRGGGFWHYIVMWHDHMIVIMWWDGTVAGTRPWSWVSVYLSKCWQLMWWIHMYAAGWLR